jgi:hypothetical protein
MVFRLNFLLMKLLVVVIKSLKIGTNSLSF